VKLILKQYKGLYETFKFYWHCYGGIAGLVGSPYFLFSLIITSICHPIWLVAKEKPWYEYPLGILPNVLGVTLAGYALLIAFGDDKFKKLFAGKYPDGSPSPFLVTNSMFIHFILMQVLAIFLGIIGSTLEIKSGWFAFLGFTIFIYSLSTAIAAAFAAQNVAFCFDMMIASEDDGDDNDKNK
jgi:hypothetical protein